MAGDPNDDGRHVICSCFTDDVTDDYPLVCANTGSGRPRKRAPSRKIERSITAADGFLTTAPWLRRLAQFRISATTLLHHHGGGARDDVPGIAGP